MGKVLLRFLRKARMMELDEPVNDSSYKCIREVVVAIRIGKIKVAY